MPDCGLVFGITGNQNQDVTCIIYLCSFNDILQVPDDFICLHLNKSR
jgi:hypothetical protein